MASQLITTWSAYDDAVGHLCARSPATLLIFDEDLSSLKLERPPRIAALARLLAAPDAQKQLTIVVQKTAFVRQYSPQLMQLLRFHQPTLTIIQAPPQLDSLRDSLLIADGRDALVRFDHAQARARLMVDDAEACAPYLRRFAEIVAAGGEPISSMTLGL
ncbi:MAG: hypothetical protein V5B32_09335 [Candidatus Accumulibacter sp. UW26]|jgi:hypothetical protein